MSVFHQNVCSADLVSGVEAQVLMTLFTVMVGVVGRIFRQLNPRCPPSQVHVLLTHRVSFERQQFGTNSTI